MAAGTDTYQSLAVPLLPADGFLIKQQDASSTTDIVTIQAASSGTGDFLVLRDSNETEVFAFQDHGALDITATTATADNVLAIAHTLNTAASTGYFQSFYTNLTISAAQTAAVQVNAFAADITIAASCVWTAGLYIYIDNSGSVTPTSVWGAYLDIQDLGAAPTNQIGLKIDKTTTNLGSNYDAFIMCTNQGSGTTTDGLLYTGGSMPTNFANFTVANGCIDAVASQDADVSGHIKIKVAGQTRYISFSPATS